MRRLASLLVLSFCLCAAFGAGWLARAQGPMLKSGVTQVGDLKPAPQPDGAGTARVYVQGLTDYTRDFVTGVYTLNPGKTPHEPHKHAEEELLLVTEGSGLIHLDGKEIPVKKGSLMYSEAWRMHGIRNTGKTPLEFYWVKWSQK
jgi:mannose-6-phosphate isomerase-like protein (cupin superfamily)